MASALPVGDISVRMRNDRHEPNGAKKQRPERIPIDPEHRSHSRNATAAVAIDSLLQNGGRREHDYATRRIRHLGAGLRIAADTPTFLDFSCHSSVSLQFQNRRSPGNAHRGVGMRARFTHPFIKTLSFAIGRLVCLAGHRLLNVAGNDGVRVEVVAHLGEPAFRGSPVLQVSPLRFRKPRIGNFRIGSPLSRCRCRASCMTCHTDSCRSRNSRRNHVVHGRSDLGPCPPCGRR
jgi:hypothetical protein